MPPPIRGKEARRAAIYLRISLDHDGDGLAIDRQREDCEAIVTDRGWTLVETYADRSISASDKTTARPDYDRMIRDVDAGLIDAIVCWDLDRLTRQPRQLEDWIDRAEETRLTIVTASGEADLSTDSGRLFARVKASVARAEVERKSARQSRAQQQRAEQGRPPKGVRPIGYELDGSIIEHEAVVVRAIYDAVRSGWSLRDITRSLNGEEPARHGAGELPPVPKTPRHTHTLDLERNAKRHAEGKAEKPVTAPYPWIPSTLLSILRNPRYAGYSVYRKRTGKEQAKWADWRRHIVRDDDGAPIKAQWEPIIDPEQWEAVQAILDDPKRTTNRTSSTARKHLGSGLYLCAECGKPVRTHGARYRCPDAHVLRSQRQIDAVVLATVRARLALPDLADLIPAPDAPEIARIDQEISDRPARLHRAQQDYDAEIIEGADLKRIRDRERPAIEALERKKIDLSAGTDLGPVAAAPDPVAEFDALDLVGRRAVIDALCEVRLHRGVRGSRVFNPDSIDIVWRAG